MPSTCSTSTRSAASPRASGSSSSWPRRPNCTWAMASRRIVLWCRAVGALILEPFGLGATTGRGTPATVLHRQRVLARDGDPSTPIRDCPWATSRWCQKAGRPRLITNSTLFSPAGVHLRRPAPGSPLPRAISDRGGVDPGGQAEPAHARHRRRVHRSVRVRRPRARRAARRHPVELTTPPERFSLSDIAGASSSAFVGPLIEAFGTAHPWLQDMDPMYSYWPVTIGSQIPGPALPTSATAAISRTPASWHSSVAASRASWRSCTPRRRCHGIPSRSRWSSMANPATLRAHAKGGGTAVPAIPAAAGACPLVGGAVPLEPGVPDIGVLPR